MHFTVKSGNISRKSDGSYMMILDVPSLDVVAVSEMLDSDKLKHVELTYRQKKRSLNANATLWLLLDKMATVLRTTKEELYIEYIRKYGVFEHLVMTKTASESLTRMGGFAYVENKGEVTVNGKTSTHLQVYFGSSTYDTSQFARLLDHVIEDAKELDIDFISQEERARLLDKWEKSAK